MTDIIPVDKFIGLANKLDPLKHNLGALKSALNVDVDDSNNIRRRNGYILTQAYTNITDSYSTKNRQDAYIVNDGTLISIRDSVDIGTGFGDKLLWDDHNDAVFVCGDKIGLIENNKFISLNHPQCPQPKVKQVNGSQPAGYYQVAGAYVDNNGREGGMTSPVTILLADNSALEVTVTQLSGYEVVIYISPVNGKYLYKWQSTDSNTAVWNGPQHLLASPANDVQFGALSIPSNISCIAWHQTKLYVCEYLPHDGKSVIWFSKAFSYHLFSKSHDYIVINDKVTVLIDIGDSLVIGTEKSIFYYSNGQLRQVANYGVPNGKPYAIDKNGNYFIWTHKGICKLNEFTNLTNEVHELPTSPSAYSVIVEQNGFGRFINLLSDKTIAENVFRS